MNRGTAQWIVPIVLAALGFLMSGYAGYVRSETAHAVELAHIQTQQANDDARLDRMEQTLSTVSSKLDELLGRQH
jgi:hypothetical protein